VGAAGQPEPLKAATQVAARLISGLVVVLAVLWSGRHPFPIYWDEAEYVNQVFDDRDALVSRGVPGLTKALLFRDNVRPPAHRLFAVPVAASHRPSLETLRLLSGCVSLLAAALLMLAARGTTSPSVSLLAASMMVSAPAFFLSGAWFGTEFPLFLATSLLLLALADRVRPLLLTVAVALGLLAKASFAGVLLPVLLVRGVLSRRERSQVLALSGGTLCGVLLAMPWWWWNGKSALAFAEYGRTFPQAAMRAPRSPEAILTKLEIMVQGLGPGLAVAIVVLTTIAALTNRSGIFWMGLAAALPIPLLALGSPVFIPRILAPALFGIGLICAAGLQRARPWLRLVLAVLILATTVPLAFRPSPSMPRVGQTDWAVLRDNVTGQAPLVAIMGGWPTLTPPELRYAWRAAGRNASVDRLWFLESGPIDWNAVMRRAGERDAIVVVEPGSGRRTDPKFAVDLNIENQHNAEFIRRLEARGGFASPIRIVIGRDEQATVRVYRRESSPR
jgi:hypothetical protein